MSSNNDSKSQGTQLEGGSFMHLFYVLILPILLVAGCLASMLAGITFYQNQKSQENMAEEALDAENPIGKRANTTKQSVHRYSARESISTIRGSRHLKSTDKKQMNSHRGHTHRSSEELLPPPNLQSNHKEHNHRLKIPESFG